MSSPNTLSSQPLGKNGPQVPRIGVGLMNIGRYNKDLSEEERMAFLDAAWSKGETFWDTGAFVPPSFSSPHYCTQLT